MGFNVPAGPFLRDRFTEHSTFRSFARYFFSAQREYSDIPFAGRLGHVCVMDTQCRRFKAANAARLLRFMMAVTEADAKILTTLSQYYVLTREQLQRFTAPSLSAEHLDAVHLDEIHLGSDRSVRRRLMKLKRDKFIKQHRISVTLPGKNGAAPLYYLTKNGAEYLANLFDDGAYMETRTRQPRVDILNHWYAVNETRFVIEQSIALQDEVKLECWINEWETVNKSDGKKEQFYLQTKLSINPPLSCSPDAGFVLSLLGHKKVFYLEQDLGTSSPNQIAARKTKGYAALANRNLHRKHFPETTLDNFKVLFITTTNYRCKTTAEKISVKQRPDLWLCINQHDLTPESFLHGTITLNHKGERGSIVKPTNNTANVQ